MKSTSLWNTEASSGLCLVLRCVCNVSSYLPQYNIDCFYVIPNQRSVYQHLRAIVGPMMQFLWALEAPDLAPRAHPLQARDDSPAWYISLLSLYIDNDLSSSVAAPTTHSTLCFQILLLFQ